MNESGMATGETKQVCMKEPELTVCRICGEPDTPEFCTCPKESKEWIRAMEKEIFVAEIRASVCSVIKCVDCKWKEAPQFCEVVKRLYLGEKQ